ncbi:MAG: hypothetical protein KGD64_14800, partial [Candidatus Heimdallarchaeota archaeon]|nr:hypothetical protein [Candidatus Heimdallarchaeota archaeon]
GISVRQLNSYLSTLNPQAIKLAQKDQITLKETLTYLTEEDVKKLEQDGIITIQQLLFLTKDQKKASSLQRINVKKFIQLLDMALTVLDIEEVKVKQLETLGVLLVQDFIVYPAETMDGKVDLSYVMIKRIKGRLPLVKAKVAKAKVAKAKVAKAKVAKTTAKSTTKSKTATKSKTTSTVAKKPAATKKPATSKKTTSTKKSTKQITLMDLATDSKKKQPTTSKTSKSSQSKTSKGGKS